MIAFYFSPADAEEVFIALPVSGGPRRESFEGDLDGFLNLGLGKLFQEPTKIGQDFWSVGKIFPFLAFLPRPEDEEFFGPSVVDSPLSGEKFLVCPELFQSLFSVFDGEVGGADYFIDRNITLSKVAIDTAGQ